MTYDELLELALKRQRERDMWKAAALQWEENCRGWQELFEETQAESKKHLDPTVND